MARIAPHAALLMLGLSAGGCGPVANGLTPLSNPGIASVNQPVVQQTDYVFDVATRGDGISGAELGRLGAWFDSLDLGYGDRISVDEGSGYGADRARSDIGRLAGTYGLMLSEGAPVTAGNVQPGSVRVIVSRAVASVPGCPIYDPLETGERHQTSTNYGCASNTNLAAMVADPNDLVLGQSHNRPIDAATATKAIKTYRDKVPTGSGDLKSETTSKTQ